jgi:hypothetical protein
MRNHRFRIPNTANDIQPVDWYNNPEVDWGTPTYALTDGGDISGHSTATLPAAFAVDVPVLNGETGRLFKIGGGTYGVSVGYDGTNLRISAFEGSNYGATNNASLTVDWTDYKDQTGTLYLFTTETTQSLTAYWMPGGSLGGQAAISLGSDTATGTESAYGTGTFAVGVEYAAPLLGNATAESNFSTTMGEVRLWTNQSEPSPINALEGQNYFYTLGDPFDIATAIDFNGTNCTITRDTSTSSPSGGVPMKMVTTASDPYTQSFGNVVWNLGAAASGQTWRMNIIAKASASGTAQLFIFGADSGSGILDFSPSNFTITTDWREYSYEYTFTNGGVVYIQSRVDGVSTVSTEHWWDNWRIYRIS